MKAKLIVIATALGFIITGAWSLASPVHAKQLTLKDHQQQISKSMADNDRETNDDQKETEDGPAVEDHQNQTGNHSSGGVDAGAQAGGTGGDQSNEEH
jgi:hypothetical protein